MYIYFSSTFLGRTLTVIQLPWWLNDEESACQYLPMQKTWVWSLGWEDPLEREMITHSSVLAWEIPWKEEPSGLQSMGWQKSQTGLSNQTTVTTTQTYQSLFHVLIDDLIRRILLVHLKTMCILVLDLVDFQCLSHLLFLCWPFD